MPQKNVQLYMVDTYNLQCDEEYFDNLKIIYIKKKFMKQTLSNNDFRMISFLQSFTNIDD